MFSTNSLVPEPQDGCPSCSPLLSPARLHCPPRNSRSPAPDLPLVRLADPARLLMTDFQHEPVFTVTADRPIDEALSDMMRFGVRALLVIHDDLLVGLITSYDIQGERPLQFLQQSTFTRHEEIEVGHIMTPWSELPVVEWSTVEVARVSDILKVFERTALTHLVVAEVARDRCERVRGILSRSRLVRQLGATS